MQQGRGEAPARHRGLVLVIDDSPEFLGLLREILEAEGYAVATCRWGHDAAARARNLRPDLLIVDVRMPGTADWDAFDRLRADLELAETPCIATSASVDLLGARSAELARLGCGMVGKPFDIDELLATVARLIGAGAASGDAHGQAG